MASLPGLVIRMFENVEVPRHAPGTNIGNPASFPRPQSAQECDKGERI